MQTYSRPTQGTACTHLRDGAKESVGDGVLVVGAAVQRGCGAQVASQAGVAHRHRAQAGGGRGCGAAALRRPPLLLLSALRRRRRSSLLLRVMLLLLVMLLMLLRQLPLLLLLK